MKAVSVRPARARAHGRHEAILLRAIEAHRGGDLDRAEPLYRRVLAMRAAVPDALHYLGVLRHQRGDDAGAVELVRRALRLAPGHADIHSNLGNIHKECGRPDQALACYRQALALAPEHPQTLGNLAMVLQALGDIDAARPAYRRWLDCCPDQAHGHFWYARFLCEHPRSREDVEQAVDHFRRAFALDPGHLKALECLGMALYGLERSEEAAEVYRAWLAHDADHPIARHMLAACGAAQAPARAGDAYVRELFDGFAASFDEQLLGKLGYRAPQALIDALDGQDRPAAAGPLDVLDAGCGTGLCGPLLRQRAGRLVGVDLSEGMLREARRRGCYDTLLAEELGAHLDAHPASYDLLLAADTLVYFGDLAPLLRAAAMALRPGGQLAFTLEASAEAAAYKLGPSGRYQHRGDHVRQVLVDSGFRHLSIEPAALRREAGRQVDGWIVLADKPRQAPPDDREMPHGSCDHA